MMKNLSNEMRVKLRWQFAELMYVFISVLLAFLIGVVIIFISGSEPLKAYSILFKCAITNYDQVLRRATVYMLTGLAVAVPVKTGMINMGGEGQVATGGLVAAVLGSSMLLPSGLHPIVCMLGAGIVGAFLGSIPAIMKVKFGSSEVVTGIMLNYILLYLLQYFTMYTFRGSDFTPSTVEIFSSAKIARVSSTAQWSYTFFIAITFCFLFQYIMNRTRLGLEMKSAGYSPLASRYQGINVKSRAVLAMLIGGAIASLGGSLEVLGGRYLFIDSYFESYGFDGIAVSYMARNNPVAIIFTSILVASLKVGAIALDRQTNVSVHFSTALQGIIITLMVTPYFVQWLIAKMRTISLRKFMRFSKAKI